MKRWLAAAGGAAIATLIVVACAEHAPQTPTQVAQSGGSGDENGLVRAQETPQPPVFPSTGPTPQTFPSTGPTPQTFPSTGPTPRTFPSTGPTPQTFPSTGPTPQTFPSTGPTPQTFPTTANPQPTPTPTPTPTTSPSPTPSPSSSPTGICPVNSVILTSADTPTGGFCGGPSSVIHIPANLQGNCTVTSVKVRFRATAGNLALSSREATFYVGLDNSFVQRITLIDQTNTNVPLSGTDLGSGCDTLRLENSESGFNAATPPYDGRFRPNANTIQTDGDPGPPGPNPGTFNDFVGKSIGTNWFLDFHDIPCEPGAAINIQCWTLELTLRNRGAVRNAPTAAEDNTAP